jgi:hypothetical protein
MLTVPAIEAILAQGKSDEGFIAALVLSTSVAVGSPLASAYEKLLRDVAHGGGIKTDVDIPVR